MAGISVFLCTSVCSYDSVLWRLLSISQPTVPPISILVHTTSSLWDVYVCHPRLWHLTQSSGFHAPATSMKYMKCLASLWHGVVTKSNAHSLLPSLSLSLSVLSQTKILFPSSAPCIFIAAVIIILPSYSILQLNFSPPRLKCACRKRPCLIHGPSHHLGQYMNIKQVYVQVNSSSWTFHGGGGWNDWLKWSLGIVCWINNISCIRIYMISYIDEYNHDLSKVWRMWNTQRDIGIKIFT